MSDGDSSRYACAVEGCGRKRAAKGLCHKHYYAARRTGALPMPPCSIPGCGRPSYHHGWCNMHYRRWSNHGDPLTRKKAANGECSGGPCSVAGCGRRGRHLLGGVVYCTKHHGRVNTHGDPDKRLRVGNGESTTAGRKAQAAVRQRRYLSTPHGKLRAAFNRAKRRAIKYGVDWNTGITKDVFVRLAAEPNCGICGLPLDGDRTLDHIVPLSRGGSNSPDNIQPAHSGCNYRKNNKVPESTLF